MLEQVLDYIHNYFEREKIQGEYTISSGSIVLPFLINGQYFRIVGSVLNDGVYKYPATGLKDETFSGEIWTMAVPPAVINLVSDINNWVTQYESIQNSPFSSESFGGYSYTKAQGSSGTGASEPISWRSVFGSRLNHWRKIS